MGSTTKIDWADATWNPATGCLHGCEYCYARNIAHRFGGNGDSQIHTLETRQYKDGTWAPAPYPFGFAPTFHKYRLHEPLRLKKPRNIFVCSMADLFGEWVPNEWIRAVFDACSAAPQHRYLFLTKNPKRYMSAYPLYHSCIQRPSKAFEAWFGYTYDGTSNQEIRKSLRRQYSRHQFISIEPLLHPIWEDEINMIRSTCDWVIIGAETGNRRGKVKPDKRWIMKIADMCEMSSVPVFMKDSLQSKMKDYATHKPRPITRQRVYQIMNIIGKQAGIEERIGCHTLRKTFGYHYYKMTGDVVSLQRILCHSYQRETLIYIGVIQENIDESLMKLNMLTGRKRGQNEHYDR